MLYADPEFCKIIPLKLNLLLVDSMDDIRFRDKQSIS